MHGPDMVDDDLVSWISIPIAVDVVDDVKRMPPLWCPSCLPNACRSAMRYLGANP